MFFVAGITGQVGGAVAQRLLDHGRAVRALVRDPAKAAGWAARGVDICRGDLADADALAAALDGVEGAFLMQPTKPIVPDIAEADAIAAAMADALRRASPPRLVVLSSVGAEQPTGLGNIAQAHRVEEALADLEFPVAFMRPGAFIENILPSLDRAAETGWFDSFLQPVDRAFPMAATADIGAEAARLLVQGWSDRRVIELGSRITPEDLARAMGEVLGRTVRPRPIPRDAWAETLEAMGFAQDRTGHFLEMEDGFNSGWIDFGKPGTERVAGVTTPAEVFARARAA